MPADAADYPSTRDDQVTGRLPWIAAAIATLAALALIPAFIAHQTERAPEVPAVHFSFPQPEGVSLDLGTSTSSQLAVSPDGRHIAFVGLHADGRTRLWLRPLDRDVPVVLKGTEGATYPFWSPSSSSLAFFAGHGLKKVPLTGGPPQAVATTSGPGSGGVWTADDTILFSTLDGPMWRVPVKGGVPEKIAGFPATGSANRFPSLIPGTSKVVSGYPEVRIGSFDRQVDVPLPIQNVLSTPIYSAGYLLFGQDGVVRAQRFDPNTMELSGDVETVTGRLNLSNPPGSGSFSASRDGVLAYVPSLGIELSRLEWAARDGGAGRDGAARGVLAPDARYSDVSLSADGLRAAAGFIGAGSGVARQIWIFDVRAGTTGRFTFEAAAQAPVWTRDGRRIYFASRKDGPWKIYRRAVGGAGPEELVDTAETQNHFVTDVSSDERFVAYNAVGNGEDVHVLPLQPGGRRTAVADSPANESGGRFSGDGRAIAYTSDESGRAEVYVQPFPRTGARRQVSVDGGSQPVWRADSKELFFVGPDGTLFASPVGIPGVEHGTPVPLFKTRVRRAAFANPAHYAVTPDGQRFLMNVPLPQPPLRISVFTNWVAAMRAAKPK
jgi:Tol biopolymer transport system component